MGQTLFLFLSLPLFFSVFCLHLLESLSCIYGNIPLIKHLLMWIFPHKFVLQLFTFYVSCSQHSYKVPVTLNGDNFKKTYLGVGKRRGGKLGGKLGERVFAMQPWGRVRKPRQGTPEPEGSTPAFEQEGVW